MFSPDDLKKFDIHCEIIPLAEKGWLTPTGGLRKEGWIIRFAFGELIKGSKTLKVFKDYIVKLDRMFGKKAYSLFKKADLSILMADRVSVRSH